MSQVELSESEKNAIAELQLRMKNDLTPALSEDVSVFYRFLKARDFDVDRAEKMLRNHIHWRKVHQIDTIVQDFKPKEVFRKHLKFSFIGFAKDGSLVSYVQAGKVDTKEMLRCIKINDYLRSIRWNTETLIKVQMNENKKTGRHNTQGIIIFDVDQCTFSNATSKGAIEILLKLIHTIQDNYPERMKTTFVINAPSYYVLVFSVVKAVMSNSTLKKIQVYSHSGWKEKLLEVIDADVLPGFLGGNRTDPDGNPLCSTFVNHGGAMCPTYELSSKDRYFKDPSAVKKAVIPPRQRIEDYVYITEKGSKIQWEFLVRNKEVGFGLDLHTLDQRVVILLPIEKYSTPDGTEEGFYKCRSTGEYAIVFDNSHSWWNSIDIEYTLKVIKDE